MATRALLAAALLLYALPSAATVAQDEALKFFDRYVQLLDAFDASVGDLYRDESKIRALRRTPGQPERVIEFSGTQWRGLVVSAMPLAKSKGDGSKYSEISAVPDGARIKVKASRFSVLKCYTDIGYYMVVGRDASGKLFIAEEYFENQPQSDC